MDKAKTGSMKILAPAGSREAFIAAVENGADAIYMGGKLFNARHFAQNFETEEIKELTRYAHLNQVKVYITLNILINNQETEAALSYVKELTEAQVDGIIVQDIGLAFVLRRILPDSIEVHASTQMTIMNSYGVKFAEMLGLSQVVLAREVSLENIAEVSKKSNILLESFGHGALCSAYSGQCLMSSMMGGRSGNRGQCVQPCRMKYKLLDRQGRQIKTEGEHLLSTKDLCTIDFLDKLAAAGISALKLEGRMKRPEYVAVITQEYRKQIDQQRGDITKLARSFNRGFTSGYYLQKPGPHLMNRLKPDNQGMLIGYVHKADPSRKTLQLKLNHPLSTGDGFDVVLKGKSILAGEVKGIYQAGKPVKTALPGIATIDVGHIKSIKALEKPLKAAEFYKTADVELLRQARESFRAQAVKRKVGISLKLKAKIGSILELEGKDRYGNIVSVQSETVCEKAVNQPSSKEMLSDQLNRFGNTVFNVVSLEIDSDPDVIVPASILNRLRRQLVEKLEETILSKQEKNYPPGESFDSRLNIFMQETDSAIKDSGNMQRFPELTVRVGDLAGLKAALEAGIGEIYFGGEKFNGCEGIYSQKEIAAACDMCLKYGARGFYVLPRLIHEDQVSAVFERCQWAREAGVYGYLAGNPGSVMMCRDWSLPNIIADWPLNVFNNFSIYCLENLGASRICLSPELTISQVTEMRNRQPLEIVVHGRLPLMILEHCLPGTCCNVKEGRTCSRPCRSRGFKLADRLNFHFPIETDMNCRNWIYNAKTLSMFEHLPSLTASGIEYFRIEAVHESPEWIKTVSEAYLNGLERADSDQWPEVYAYFLEQLNSITPHGFTKGHYFRGV